MLMLHQVLKKNLFWPIFIFELSLQAPLEVSVTLGQIKMIMAECFELNSQGR